MHVSAPPPPPPLDGYPWNLFSRTSAKICREVPGFFKNWTKYRAIYVSTANSSTKYFVAGQRYKWKTLWLSHANNGFIVLEDICCFSMARMVTRTRYSVTLYVIAYLVTNMLASGPRVRGFKPGPSRWIFLYIKILSMPSFGGEVK
jgi:hypothetical protein